MLIRVLLIVDSPLYRKMLRNNLSSLCPSVRITEARDGFSALRTIERQVPDLIFMDIKLPGMNGFEITRKIKEKYAAIPIIILSSENSPEYRQAAIEAGANYFFAKDEFSGERIMRLANSIFPDCPLQKTIQG